jgi:hypothetical protein
MIMTVGSIRHHITKIIISISIMVSIIALSRYLGAGQGRPNLLRALTGRNWTWIEKTVTFTTPNMRMTNRTKWNTRETKTRTRKKKSSSAVVGECNVV